jgi:hypothetical protein
MGHRFTTTSFVMIDELKIKVVLCFSNRGMSSLQQKYVVFAIEVVPMIRQTLNGK